MKRLSTMADRVQSQLVTNMRQVLRLPDQIIGSLNLKFERTLASRATFQARSLSMSFFVCTPVVIGPRL